MALTKIKGAGVNISATEKLYFDDGGNTYIYESAADVLDVYVGGANMVKLTESTTDTVTVTGDLTVGVDGTGHDVKFFGDTASSNMTWDTSADDLILNDATLKIDQDDNAKSIEIDTEATSQYAIVVDTPANTTAAVMALVDCNSLTTGQIAKFTSGSDDNSTRNLVHIINDHASADNTVGLLIQQDGADASIELAGNGSIKFPGTQGASSDANSLDDYEEGTWTPTITFGGAAVSVSYGSVVGHYTKVGRVVYISGFITLSDKGSSTGQAKVSGLPFSAGYYSGIGIAEFNNISYANNITGSLYSSDISLWEHTEAGTRTTITDGNFTDTSNMTFSATYHV